MWAGVELAEVEAFLAVAEELHFGRTAERLGLSPARVTQLIQRFERRIGDRLVERSSRAVSLTPAGRVLAGELVEARDAMDSALRGAAGRARGLAATLRVGHIATVENIPAVDTVIARFGQSAPGTRVSRRRFDQFDYIGALRSGEVDIWLTWWPAPEVAEDPAAGLRCGPAIVTVAPVLLVAPPHPLARRREVSVNELADHVLLRFPQHWSQTLLESRWVPTHTPQGRPIRLTDAGPGRSMRDMMNIVADGETAYLTPGAVPDVLSLPPAIHAVAVTGAEPFVLTPWWVADNETATIRAFVDCIASPPPAYNRVQRD